MKVQRLCTVLGIVWVAGHAALLRADESRAGSSIAADGTTVAESARSIPVTHRADVVVIGKATAGGAAMRQAHGVLFQGQAAGTAAAMAVKERVALRNIDVGRLQALLKADGVVIPYPREDAAASR